MQYLLTYMRKNRRADQPLPPATRAPPPARHCRARPFRLRAPEECEYCDFIITTGEHDWVLSNLDSIKANTQLDGGGVVPALTHDHPYSKKGESNMGLIKAIGGAIGGVLADQWVDYIKCDAMPMNVLAAKGYKFVSNRSSNTKGSDNVISDGSRVDIADGQFMMIVENGRIVDFSAEPGQYLYQTGTQPSMLSGGFKGLAESFKQVGKRFTAGGQELSTQRGLLRQHQGAHGQQVGRGRRSLPGQRIQLLHEAERLRRIFL